ncbi:low density lipoprotein receptor adapter protein 1-A-like isoform X1 [Astyanax mexicanus]|uniref:Low density lipoprotein receptor adapter protein 1-A-like isoform X1 n=1 Tax=Astyanax mexicanus TaxID=7994 RepID=A0A8B9RHZ9_ASTMX|nr:low density lipoprotein receptor adapter protein 1-A-like isoform X1 [Astyanax mexicanus]
MDVLKSAGRALRSPSFSKHHKLPENWTDTKETLVEGMTFNLRYLGVTVVDQPKGEDLSAAAVKRIVAMAKAGGRKLPKVALKVTPQGIVLYDSVSNQLIESVSIYRISYCTADKMHDKVFAYIAQNQQNETLECHAFLCAKRKVAQAVTLTVAQAFRVAFEFWQNTKEDQPVKSGPAAEISNGTCSEPDASDSAVSLKGTDAATGNLLDIEDSPVVVLENTDNQEAHVDNRSESENNNTIWELDDGLDEAFSRLAESRTNPQVLDIGLTPLGCNSDPENDKANGNTALTTSFAFESGW